MTTCYYCNKEIPDRFIGLINFGYMDHKCPEQMFRHCPQCGTDLDMDNDHQWIPKKKLTDYREKLMEKLFPHEAQTNHN